MKLIAYYLGYYRGTSTGTPPHVSPYYPLSYKGVVRKGGPHKACYVLRFFGEAIVRLTFPAVGLVPDFLVFEQLPHGIPQIGFPQVCFLGFFLSDELRWRISRARSVADTLRFSLV